MSSLIPFTDWAYDAHDVPFEQSKNAPYVPILSGPCHYPFKSHVACYLAQCRMSNQKQCHVTLPNYKGQGQGRRKDFFKGGVSF